MPGLSSVLLLAVVAGPPALEWQAPEGCPSAEDVQRSLGVLAGHTDLADVRARGVVRRRGAQYELRLEVSTGRLKQRRTLRTDACGTLGEAAALLIAISVDPLEVAEHLVAEPRRANPREIDRDATLAVVVPTRSARPAAAAARPAAASARPAAASAQPNATRPASARDSAPSAAAAPASERESAPPVAAAASSERAGAPPDPASARTSAPPDPAAPASARTSAPPDPASPDPERASALPGATEPASALPGATEPASAREPAPTPASAHRPDEPARASSPPARAPARDIRLFVRPEVSLDVGATPSQSGNIAGALGLLLPRLRLELHGLYTVPVPIVNEGRRYGTFARWTVGARACGRVVRSVLEVPLCAGLEGRQFILTDPDLTQTSARPYWLSMLVGLGIVWSPHPRVGLGARTEFVIAPYRAYFRSDADATQPYLTQVLNLRFSLGVEVRFGPAVRRDGSAARRPPSKR